MTLKDRTITFFAFIVMVLITGCQPDPPAVSLVSIPEAIPIDAVKFSPEMDPTPPILHSDEWALPVPLRGAPTTAGLEDSAFITPDGNTLFYFFTPDFEVSAAGQLTDGATGIYVSHLVEGQWESPQRVLLQDVDKLSLDGCAFVQGNKIWFCTAREGNLRELDIWTAEILDGVWTNWKNAGEQINLEYMVGEMHITADGDQLYYHSHRPNGSGGMDIWVTNRMDGDWAEPINLGAVNTAGDEGFPFISPDGAELWFTRTYLGTPAIFRSRMTAQGWGAPELIVSQFAGEPSLDAVGNLYFTHHFVVNGEIREADIYVAYKIMP